MSETDTHSITLPEETFEFLANVARDAGLLKGGRPSIRTLLTLISENVDPDDFYNLADDAGCFLHADATQDDE